MLVLSRKIGESLLIDDVELTLVSAAPTHAEISLVKTTGGRPLVMTLQRQDRVEICYNVQIVLVDVKDSKVRLGLDFPNEVKVVRKELHWPS